MARPSQRGQHPHRCLGDGVCTWGAPRRLAAAGPVPHGLRSATSHAADLLVVTLNTYDPRPNVVRGAVCRKGRKDARHSRIKLPPEHMPSSEVDTQVAVHHLVSAVGVPRLRDGLALVDRAPEHGVAVAAPILSGCAALLGAGLKPKLGIS